MLKYEPAGEPHPHVAVVMDGHRRLENGDLTAVEAMFARDIIWHESGVIPPARAYVGVADVMAYWKTYFAAAGGGFTQDIISIMANDEYATSVVQLTGTGGYRGTAIDLMRMHDMKIAEFWRCYDDHPAAHTFFTRTPQRATFNS